MGKNKNAVAIPDGLRDFLNKLALSTDEVVQYWNIETWRTDAITCARFLISCAANFKNPPTNSRQAMREIRKMMESAMLETDIPKGFEGFRDEDDLDRIEKSTSKNI